MDKGIKAAKTQLARDRIRAATLTLVERHGLDQHADALTRADAMPVTVRDLYQLEAVADLLDALVLSEGSIADGVQLEDELATLTSISPAVAAKLVDAGITNVATLRDASDDDLLAIKGVGAKVLRAIRAEVGTPTAAEPELPAASTEEDAGTETDEPEPDEALDDTESGADGEADE